jgi:cytochrome c-type biogenesis protein CcmH/NrfF
MPLWLWLLPVPWLAVLAFWAVVAFYAARRGRARDRAREDAERRMMEAIDCQRWNPRVHGRPDQWRT